MTEAEYEEQQRQKEEEKRQRAEERRVKKLKRLKEDAITALADVMRDTTADKQSRVRAASYVLEYADSTYEKMGTFNNDIL